MNYRVAEILDAETLSGASTKTIDLDYTDPLSRIIMRWHRTKTLEGMSAAGPADITKIELVDGAEVLASLTGYEAQALAMYNNPHTVQEYSQLLVSNSQVDFFQLDFGRKLWDRALAFDPTKFINPQLKVSYDVDVSDTGVTSGTFEVYGYFFNDRRITPVGMLAPKEHYANALGADGTWTNVELPNDRLIRRMNVRLHYTGYEPWYVADRLWFTENSGKQTVFDWDTETLYRVMHTEYPPIITKFIAQTDASGDTYYVPQSEYWVTPVPVQHADPGKTFGIGGGTGGRGGKIAADLSAGGEFACIVHGYLPWSTMDFKLGDLDDMEDWYDPAGKGKVEMRILSHSAGTSGACAVVLEQLRRY